MLDLPVEVKDFILYRSPDSTAIEVFVFPEDLPVLETLQSYEAGRVLSDQEELSIDSYIIDTDVMGDYGSANREEALMWLTEDLEIPHKKADKIVKAIFSWNLVYVTLSNEEDEIDATVPKHQKHPVVTDYVKRDIKIKEENKYNFDDPYDPLLNHIEQEGKNRPL